MYNEEKMQQRLRNLREESNLNQYELAKKIGVNHCTICAYETGSRLPKIDILDAIADFYGVSIDWLTGRTDKKIPRTEG